MKDEISSKSDNKKPVLMKLIIFAVALLLLIVAAFVFIFHTQNKPDPASAAFIREVAARQLNKDPNELTDEDFASITQLCIAEKEYHRSSWDGRRYESYIPIELSDIKLIEKFTNLEELTIMSTLKVTEIPTWMRILSKIGLIDITKRNALDLGPIEKLENLKILDIMKTPVKSYEPLSKLKNLESLSIWSMKIEDCESLKKLKNLKYLSISGNNMNITQEQIKELQKSLPETKMLIEYID